MFYLNITRPPQYSNLGLYSIQNMNEVIQNEIFMFQSLREPQQMDESSPSPSRRKVEEERGEAAIKQAKIQRQGKRMVVQYLWFNQMQKYRDAS